jgi:hypothetical protein
VFGTFLALCIGPVSPHLNPDIHTLGRK